MICFCHVHCNITINQPKHSKEETNVDNNNDQFDFIDGESIIEVKTTTNNLRVHSFRHEQIVSLIRYEGILCSVKTKITTGGESVQGLSKRISDIPLLIKYFSKKATLYRNLISLIGAVLVVLIVWVMF